MKQTISWKHLLVFFILQFLILDINAMDHPEKPIWVQTNDNHIVAIDHQKIKKMHTLSLLLAYQRGSNSKKNGIDAFMINAQELQLLDRSLATRTIEEFDAFYYGLAQKDYKNIDYAKTLLFPC